MFFASYSSKHISALARLLFFSPDAERKSKGASPGYLPQRTTLRSTAGVLVLMESLDVPDSMWSGQIPQHHNKAYCTAVGTLGRRLSHYERTLYKFFYRHDFVEYRCREAHFAEVKRGNVPRSPVPAN